MLDASPKCFSPYECKSDTLLGKTHERLKWDIICGKLAPGQALRIEHLKRDYDVSGSTLREAITLLIADRLVVAEEKKGFKVSPVSKEGLIDITKTRILLECEAIRQAIELGDDNWEAGIVTAYHMLCSVERRMINGINDDKFAEWEEKHCAYHLSLYSAVPSEWMRHFLELLYSHSERYRRIFKRIVVTHQERKVQEEHKEIFEAVISRNSNTASKLIEEHLMKTLSEVYEYID